MCVCVLRVRSVIGNCNLKLEWAAEFMHGCVLIPVLDLRPTWPQHGLDSQQGVSTHQNRPLLLDLLLRCKLKWLIAS